MRESIFSLLRLHPCAKIYEEKVRQMCTFSKMEKLLLVLLFCLYMGTELTVLREKNSISLLTTTATKVFRMQAVVCVCVHICEHHAATTNKSIFMAKYSLWRGIWNARRNKSFPLSRQSGVYSFHIGYMCLCALLSFDANIQVTRKDLSKKRSKKRKTLNFSENEDELCFVVA